MVEQWARDVVRFRGYGIRSTEHDDLVQQTLIATWRACSRPGFVVRKGLRAVVHKIALARCVDWLRRQRPMQELDDNLADPLPEPTQQLADSDQWNQVQGALARLGKGCREIVQLRFFHELPYAEMAKLTGRNEATLRVRLFQCMKEVRKQLMVTQGRLDVGADG